MMSAVMLRMIQGRDLSVYGPTVQIGKHCLQCSASFQISGSNEQAIRHYVISVSARGRGVWMEPELVRTPTYATTQ